MTFSFCRARRCSGPVHAIFPESPLSAQPQWWGYSKEHGWVVLDREVDCNGPGMRGDLLFLRCRDNKVFTLRREQWRLPAYQFAPNYVRSLTEDAAAEASSEVEALMARWPELRESLRAQYGAMQAEQREAERAKRAADGVPEPAVRRPRRAKAAKVAPDAGSE
jgi:hypothetical protein